MTNTKELKRTLLSSVVALLVCFAMLLGTTFAWFTDSVTSGSNIIKAGNLDIDVEYTLDGKEWKDLEGATDLFGGLWEPGHTEVVALKVTNNGTLALKYNANMNIFNETVGKTKDGEDIVLSDILEVSTFWCQYDDGIMGQILMGGYFGSDDPLNTYYNTASFKASNVLGSDLVLVAGDANYFIVKVDMPETVGNEANAKDKDSVPSIAFGINVLATQCVYEEDSFGNGYDEDASINDAITTLGGIINMTEDEYNQVNVEEEANVQINMGGYAIDNAVINHGNLVINGDGITDEDLTGNIITDKAGFQNYGTATLTDVDMKAGSTADYSNIGRAGSETVYNNVNIVSAGGGIGAADGAKVTFNSGSVAVNSASTSGRYVFYTEGAGSEITINGGVFSFSKTLNQKRAYIYAGAGTTVYVNGGTFGAASSRDGYTAGILGTGTVIITGGTFGFDPTNWLADGYSVIKSGSTWTVYEGDAVSTAEQLATALTASKKVVLAADVALTEGVTVAAGADVTLDLNGKTLSYTNNVAAGTSAIENKGTLTLTNGTVTYKSTAPSTTNSYATNAITNSGELTIDGATVINTTETGASYAIESTPGSKLVVNSGKIESAKTAIRVREGSDVTINGGEVFSTDNGYAIQIHLLQGKFTTQLTINGGTLTGGNGVYNLALYSYAAADGAFAGTTVTIKGGTFNGDVCFGGGKKDAKETVVINGGTFNGEVGRYTNTAEGWEDIAH